MSEQQIASSPMGDEEEIFGSVEPVIDEKKPMIDFGLVEDEKSPEYIDHQIEEIVEASVALESYIQLLNKASWDGVSKQTAKAILIGVQRIDRTLGDRSALAISLEDEDNELQRSGHENEQSKLSKDGLGARAKELWNKFIEFIKRAFATGRAKLLKAYEYLNGRVAKMQALYDSFDGWSPNGPTGGKKIKVPAKLAAYMLHEGKPVDIGALSAMCIYIDNNINRQLIDASSAMDRLKGTETPEELEQTFAFNLPPLPNPLPSNFAVTLDNNKFDYEFIGEAEEIEVQVRSKNEIQKYLKVLMAATKDIRGPNAAKAEAAGINLLVKASDLRLSNGPSVEKLREILMELNALNGRSLDLRVELSHTIVLAYEYCSLERGAGRHASESVSTEDNEEKNDGILAKLKAMLARIIEVLTKAFQVVKEKATKFFNINTKIKVQSKADSDAAKNGERTNHNGETGRVKVKLNGYQALWATVDGEWAKADYYHPLAAFLYEEMTPVMKGTLDKLSVAIQNSDYEAMVALKSPVYPEYRGTDYPHIKIQLSDGVYTIERPDATTDNGEPVELDMLELKDYTDLMDGINANASYLEKHYDSVGDCSKRLMEMARDISKAMNNPNVETKVLIAALDVIQSLANIRQACDQLSNTVTSANRYMYAASAHQK